MDFERLVPKQTLPAPLLFHYRHEFRQQNV